MQQTYIMPLVSVALAIGLPAQAVLDVPGTYPTIQDALNVASPGDTVAVGPGTYPGFQANQSVTIRTSGTVSIGAIGSGAPFGVIIAPPPGQTVHLLGQDDTRVSNVSVTSGRVTMDGWTMLTGLLVQDSYLHLQDCYCTGPAPTAPVLVATDATITAADTEIRSNPFGVAVAPIVDLSNTRFHASHCTIVDDVLLGGGLFHSDIRAQAGSQVWLADCTLSAGQSDSCSLTVSNSTVRADRTSVLQSGNCSMAIPGLLLGVSRTAPLTAGQPFELSYRTDPNAFVAVFASPFLGETSFGPLLEQPSWLDDTYSFGAALLVADSAGLATASFNIPGGPGISGKSLWFKGISGLSFPLQASPPVGGIAR